MPSRSRYAQNKVWKRLRLKAKQTRHHSPATASSPRKENWRKSNTSLMMPIDFIDGAFACAVDGFAQGGLELVGHLDLGAGIFGRWSRQWREPLLPAWMMRITTSRDVRLDAAAHTCG